MTGPVHGRHIPILTPSLVHKHLLLYNLQTGQCFPAHSNHASQPCTSLLLPCLNPPSSLSLLAAIDDLVEENVSCITHGPLHQSGRTVHKCTKLIRTHDAVHLLRAQLQLEWCGELHVCTCGGTVRQWCGELHGMHMWRDSKAVVW